MKRKLLIVFAVIFVGSLALNDASAQRRKATTSASYNTALGLGIDFGDDPTFVGPSIKHFFTPNNVGKAEVLFGRHTTMLSLYYQYHGDIPNAAGLKWTLGLGGSLDFYSFRGYNQTDFAFRPTGGFDYKIPNVPLQFEFDWRPFLQVTHNGGSEVGRFGFGFRYCF
jgi:hypothetical protein